MFTRIESTFPQLISLWYISILSSHFLLVLLSNLFPWGFLMKAMHYHHATHSVHQSPLIDPNNISLMIQIRDKKKLLNNFTVEIPNMLHPTWLSGLADWKCGQLDRLFFRRMLYFYMIYAKNTWMGAICKHKKMKFCCIKWPFCTLPRLK